MWGICNLHKTFGLNAACKGLEGLKLGVNRETSESPELPWKWRSDAMRHQRHFWKTMKLFQKHNRNIIWTLWKGFTVSFDQCHTLELRCSCWSRSGRHKTHAHARTKNTNTQTRTHILLTSHFYCTRTLKPLKIMLSFLTIIYISWLDWQHTPNTHTLFTPANSSISPCQCWLLVPLWM